MQYSVEGGYTVQCIDAVRCWGGFRHRNQVNLEGAEKVQGAEKTEELKK